MGSQRGDFWTLAASRENKVLGFVQLDGSVSRSPVAANGVLYVTSSTRIHACARN